MLKKLLKEIEELDAKATKGPWYDEPCDSEVFGELLVIESECYDDVMIYAPRDGLIDLPSDVSRFIARARTLLPLCAQLIAIYEKYADYNSSSPHVYANMRGEIDAALAASGEVMVRANAICGQCGCQVFNNKLPHYVELGYTGRIICCPCYRQSRKQAAKTWKRKALEAKKQYQLFLLGISEPQP
jgi:hypothetical protein